MAARYRSLTLKERSEIGLHFCKTIDWNGMPCNHPSHFLVESEPTPTDEQLEKNITPSRVWSTMCKRHLNNALATPEFEDAVNLDLKDADPGQGSGLEYPSVENSNVEQDPQNASIDPTPSDTPSN